MLRDQRVTEPRALWIVKKGNSHERGLVSASA
jgi:hypothetical protein